MIILTIISRYGNIDLLHSSILKELLKLSAEFRISIRDD